MQINKNLFLFVVAVLFLLNQTTFCFTPNPGESVKSILTGVGQVIDAGGGGDCETRTKIYNPGDSATYTISAAGKYVVVEDFPNGKIEITADDVDLDLNGREIAADIGGNAIIFVSGARKNISIYNGYLTDNSDSMYGVQVSGGSSAIRLENITVLGAGFPGIYLSGTNGNEVTDCRIVDCDFSGNYYSVHATYASRLFMSNCYMTDFGGTAIYIINTNDSFFCDCYILGASKSSPLYCVSSEDSYNNLFLRCVVKNIETTGVIANAFSIEGDAQKIIDCVVDHVDGTNSFGIWVFSGALDSVLKNNTLIDCGIAIKGSDATSFTDDGNLAIKNLSFNNNGDASDYDNVQNIDAYYPTGIDNIGNMENVYVDWTP